MTKKREEKETNAIVQVAESMAILSAEEKNRLFNSDASGLMDVTESRSIPYPREVKIIQKLTGDKLFQDPELNDRSAKGKIYFEPKRVKNEKGEYEHEYLLEERNMFDSVCLTILKIESGVEIYREEKRDDLDYPIQKTVCRSKDMIKSVERDAWKEAHPDLVHKNMIRVLATPYTADEVVKMVGEGENPFVVVTLSGGDGWNIWNVMRDEMTTLKKQMGIKGELNKVLSSLFQVVFTTTEVTQGGNTYFILKPKMGLNNPSEALKFEELVNELSDGFSFYVNVEGRHDPALRSVTKIVMDGEQVEDTFDSDEPIEHTEAETMSLDDPDLPF